MTHSGPRPLPPLGRAPDGATERPAPRVPLTSAEWDKELPARWYARRGRRLLDWALMALVLPPAAAVLAAVALANLIVFRDPRQVLFVQPRMGWRNQPFRIYKFRTMREARASELDSWSSGEDRLRVTRLGRFLRNTHLDELPQLLNILKGDMGFIGPRPEMLEIEAWAAQEVEGFSSRLALRPGITGLAQITQGYTGQDADAYAEKLERNAEYMREVSLALDLQIVVRTILWMVRGRGWSWNSAGAAQQGAPEADSGAGQGAVDGDRRRAG